MPRILTKTWLCCFVFCSRWAKQKKAHIGFGKSTFLHRRCGLAVSPFFSTSSFCHTAWRWQHPDGDIHNTGNFPQVTRVPLICQITRGKKNCFCKAHFHKLAGNISTVGFLNGDPALAYSCTFNLIKTSQQAYKCYKQKKIWREHINQEIFEEKSLPKDFGKNYQPKIPFQRPLISTSTKWQLIIGQLLGITWVSTQDALDRWWVARFWIGDFKWWKTTR